MSGNSLLDTSNLRFVLQTLAHTHPNEGVTGPCHLPTKDQDWGCSWHSGETQQVTGNG